MFLKEFRPKFATSKCYLKPYDTANLKRNSLLFLRFSARAALKKWNKMNEEQKTPFTAQVARTSASIEHKRRRKQPCAPKELLLSNRSGTGYLGVYTNGSHFEAKLTINGQRLYLGTYNTAAEAANAVATKHAAKMQSSKPNSVETFLVSNHSSQDFYGESWQNLIEYNNRVQGRGNKETVNCPFPGKKR